MPIYPRAVYTWGVVLWVVVQDKPMVYEQEEVVDVIAMKHRLMQKNFDTFESTNRDEQTSNMAIGK